jgi:ribulose-phosphate 3-epimerase
MDGHFVPNITVGPPVVAALRRVTQLPLDVHLMIVQPEQYLARFLDAGADILTVQVEACAHLHQTIQVIHERGARAGVALNPATLLATVSQVLRDVDLVLVMMVEPGFGGQELIPSMVQKIAALRRALDESASLAELEVDGGIDPQTAAQVVQAGARVLVAGEAVYGAAVGVAQAVREIAAAARSALPLVARCV